MIRYITYHNKRFDVFKTWNEAKDFVDKHDGCRYQKVHSNKEEQEFRKKWEGKDDFTKKSTSPSIIIRSNALRHGRIVNDISTLTRAQSIDLFQMKRLLRNLSINISAKYQALQHPI